MGEADLALLLSGCLVSLSPFSMVQAASMPASAALIETIQVRETRSLCKGHAMRGFRGFCRCFTGFASMGIARLLIEMDSMDSSVK